jgi:hypothetical protein
MGLSSLGVPSQLSEMKGGLRGRSSAGVRGLSMRAAALAVRAPKDGAPALRATREAPGASRAQLAIFRAIVGCRRTRGPADGRLLQDRFEALSFGAGRARLETAE